MHFKGIGVHADVKYIDPTYMVRACRANASDAILCTVLGQNAVSLTLLFLNDLAVHLFELLQSGYMKNRDFSLPAGPCSICWLQWYHFLHLQQSLCLPSNHRSHNSTEACEP
jgi:hypothetical protein